MEDIKEKAVKVMAQHAALERHTGRVLGLVSGRFDWIELAAELAALYDIVTDHFELEGRGGYMHDVRDALPGRGSALDELEHAHVMLEETLREIRMECARAVDEERVRELFQRWLDRLVAHEEAENRLCYEAFGALAVP